jgi:hypothetical protein
MIHYTCDLCHRKLDEDQRFVVKIEMFAALDPLEDDEADEDRDHLAEIQESLERLDDDLQEVDESLYQELRFDLCPACRRKFAKDPLGRELLKFDFSKN